MPTPNDGMVEEAQRGLDWREEYGRGGTQVGVSRARDIINRVNLSDDTIGRMVSYFARHEVDKEGQGWSPDQDGYPSAGRIAWALWGGDPGKAWAGREWDKIQSEKGAAPMKQKNAQLKLETIDETGAFSGYASVFGVKDSYGDIVLSGAFVDSLKAHKTAGTMPALLWQHDAREPIGYWSKMVEDEKGLYVEGKLLVDDDPLSRRAYAHLKAGSVSGLSIGFVTLDEEYDAKSATNNIKQVELWETSIVTFPANTASRVENVRAADSISTIREFEAVLRDELGFTHRQARKIALHGWAKANDREDQEIGEALQKLLSKIAE